MSNICRGEILIDWRLTVLLKFQTRLPILIPQAILMHSTFHEFRFYSHMIFESSLILFCSLVENVKVQTSRQPTNGVTYFRAIATTTSIPYILKPYLPLFCHVLTKYVFQFSVYQSVDVFNNWIRQLSCR